MVSALEVLYALTALAFIASFVQVIRKQARAARRFAIAGAFGIAVSLLLYWMLGSSVSPHLLSQREYLATMTSGVTDITGRENTVQPEGVVDIEPYLAAVPKSDLQGEQLRPDSPPTSIYRTRDGRFDHVLYACNGANVFLVIVVQLRPERVQGHYLLDLNKEYGVESQ